MPRRQRKHAPPALPYNFSLPGGSEMDALGAGFSLNRARGEGYMTAATLANRNIMADSSKQQPWVLGDAKTGLLRSQNAPQLFAAFPNEMVELFTHENAPHNITADEFARGKAWKKVLNIDRNQPLTGSLSDIGKHYVKLREGVFLAHRLEGESEAKAPKSGWVTPARLLAFDYQYKTPMKSPRTVTNTAQLSPVTVTLPPGAW